MRTLPRAPKTASPAKLPPARPTVGLALALGLLTLGALAFAAWSWKQTHRPGAVHLQAGLEAAALHQDALAEQEWTQGAQEDPAFPDCYAQLGDLYLQQQRFPEAVTEYQAAAKLSPRDGTVFLRLNRALLGAHQFQAGLEAIRRASELRPDDPDAAGLYGLQAATLGNRPVALIALRKAHALKPDDKDYLLELARQEMNGLDMTGAERELKALLQADPDSGEANRLMALLYKQKPPTPENMMAALELAQRARQNLPDSPDVYLLIGQLNLSAGHTSDALTALQKAQSLNPNAEEILNGLVTCYTRLHDTAQADKAATTLQTLTRRRDRIEHLKLVVQANSADISARLELARLEEASGNLPAAAADYAAAAGEAPAEMAVKRASASFYRRHPTRPAKAGAAH